MATDTQEILKTLAIKLHEIDAIKFGNFQTKSGLQTPIYIDLCVIISHPDVMNLLAKLLSNFVDEQKIEYKHICGVPYTALPIATLLSIKQQKQMLIRHKEAKVYGTKKLIEGKYDAGDSCLIIGEIITSGSSILETVADLRAEGIVVNDSIVVIDRQQGGAANITRNDVRVHSLFKISKFLGILREANRIDEACIKEITDYIANNQAPVKKELPNVYPQQFYIPVQVQVPVYLPLPIPVTIFIPTTNETVANVTKKQEEIDTSEDENEKEDNPKMTGDDDDKFASHDAFGSYVLDNVIAGVRHEGVGEQVLQELQKMWANKLMARKEFKAPGLAESQPPPSNKNNKNLDQTSAVEQHQTINKPSTSQSIQTQSTAAVPIQSAVQQQQTALAVPPAVIIGLDQSKILSIQITLPALANLSESRVLEIQVPASALQKNILNSALISGINTIIALPLAEAALKLQQYINAVLAHCGIPIADQVDSTADDDDDDDDNSQGNEEEKGGIGAGEGP